MVRPSRNASSARRAQAQAGPVYPIRCAIRNEGTETEVFVYDSVGDYGWDSGISAKVFAERIAGIRGSLRCRVSSAGGDVFDGVAITNALRNHKGTVTTVVDGLAASIASVIVQAGHVRVASAGSMLMVHEPFAVVAGDAADMVQMSQVLDKVGTNLASIYADRAGGTPVSWRDKMRAETWYTADEAKAAGLVDKVSDTPAVLPASFDLAAFSDVPARIAARLREMPRSARPGPSVVLTDRQLRLIGAGLKEGLRAAGLPTERARQKGTTT